MLRRKFSQFNLPSAPISDLYLVGYQEGENNENQSVRLKASDLSFGVSQSAGVSSVNGISGIVSIEAGDNVIISKAANTLYIHTEQATVDDEFNAASEKAQSGIAISGELSNYLKFNENATITGNISFAGDSTQIDFLNVINSLRVNGNTVFNGSVTVSNENLGAFISSMKNHIADEVIHINDENQQKIDDVHAHISDTVAHLSWEERYFLNQIDQYASKSYVEELSGKYTFIDQQTVNASNNLSAKYFHINPTSLPQNQDVLKVILPCRTSAYSPFTTDPRYLGIWVLMDDGTWSKHAVSDNATIQQAGQDTIFEFTGLRFTDAETKFGLLVNQDDDIDTISNSIFGIKIDTSMTAEGYALGSNGARYNGLVNVKFRNRVENVVLSTDEKNALDALLARKDELLALLS